MRKVMARPHNGVKYFQKKKLEYTRNKMAADWKAEWKGVEVENCQHWRRHPGISYQLYRDKMLKRAKARWHDNKHNPEFLRKRYESRKLWMAKNADRVRIQRREYNSQIPPEKRRQYRRAMRARPENKVAFNIRRRLKDVLRGRGYRASSTSKLSAVGCSRAELRAHIERQFKRGMTWANYGKVWHIDHIEPIADLVRRGHAHRANHFTNLRPLWAEDNLDKSDAVPHNHQPCLFL